jgi:hypothetical protein
MKRIVLAMLVAVAGAACRCRPAEEGAALVGRPPPPMRSGPSRNVETVVEAPPGSDVTEFGRHLALVAVPGGEATVAFTTNGILYAARSDRARSAWLPPMKIGAIGGGDRPVALALDRSNGLLAIAYVDKTQQLQVATSKDSGMTWHSQFLNPGTPARDPSIAMAGGRAYVTWVDAAGAHYATGRPDDLSTWRPTEVPTETEAVVPVVAVDSRGEPGVAWASGVPLDVFFWRPTAPASVVVHTGDVNDTYDLALAFEGARPRIVLRASVAGVYGLWSAASSDAGRTWPSVSRIPPDGAVEPVGFPVLAVSPGGRAAVVTQTHDVLEGDGRCGWPKLSRSDDFGAWTTCSPIQGSRLGNGEPVVAFDGEHLIVAVTNHDSDARAPGIYVWREVSPAAAALPLPGDRLHAARQR